MPVRGGAWPMPSMSPLPYSPPVLSSVLRLPAEPWLARPAAKSQRPSELSPALPPRTSNLPAAERTGRRGPPIGPSSRNVFLTTKSLAVWVTYAGQSRKSSELLAASWLPKDAEWPLPYGASGIDRPGTCAFVIWGAPCLAIHSRPGIPAIGPIAPMPPMPLPRPAMSFSVMPVIDGELALSKVLAMDFWPGLVSATSASPPLPRPLPPCPALPPSRPSFPRRPPRRRCCGMLPADCICGAMVLAPIGYWPLGP
mmetsp:Transcript_74884/g.219374  ORF Transcript_74884/g.219374 Transcript_74884/m.219374 type:complete len:254 (+) Transcript_74884:615-1376(+)